MKKISKKLDSLGYVDNPNEEGPGISRRNAGRFLMRSGLKEYWWAYLIWLAMMLFIIFG